MTAAVGVPVALGYGAFWFQGALSLRLRTLVGLNENWQRSSVSLSAQDGIICAQPEHGSVCVFTGDGNGRARTRSSKPSCNKACRRSPRFRVGAQQARGK